MPRYDYKIKKNLFQNRESTRHQNFQSIEKRYASRRRSHNALRIILILATLIVLIGILIFSANADQKRQPSNENKNHQEFRFESVPEEI